MAAKTKTCPQCGTTMDFRLGAYECPHCGHTEEDKAVAAAAPAERSTGPGFRKEAWHRSATPTAGQPGQVPPPQSIGTIYSPGAAPPAEHYGAAPASYDPYPSLQIEKIIYFGLQVIGTVVLFIGMIAASSMGMPSNLGVNMGAVMFGVFLGGVISLGLYWFVLFGDQVWAKYCCGGCLAIGILFTIPGMFMATPNASYGMPSNTAFDVMGGIIGILLNLWLLSILWRDVQRLQGH